MLIARMAGHLDGARAVRHCADLELVIAWFGGTTFNIYSTHTAQEVDCFTLPERPDAQGAAQAMGDHEIEIVRSMMEEE